MLQIHPPVTFMSRLVGVITLDLPTFRRIEQDRRGTLQAAAVVGLVAVAAAIGGVSQFGWLTVALLVTIVGWLVASGRAFSLIESATRRSMNRSRFRAMRSQLDRRQEISLIIAGVALLSLTILGAQSDGFGWSSIALTVPFLSWFSFTGVAWYQARCLPAHTQRPTFGSLMRTLGFAHAPGVFAFFGFIPLIGLLLAVIVPIWAVLTTVFAIRHTLGFTLDQALATAILATSATALGTALMVIAS